MTPDQLISLVEKLPAPGLLALFIAGLWRRWWVMGWYAELVEKERDEYKAIAQEGLRTTRRAVRVAGAGSGKKAPK